MASSTNRVLCIFTHANWNKFEQIAIKHLPGTAFHNWDIYQHFLNNYLVVERMNFRRYLFILTTKEHIWEKWTFCMCLTSKAQYICQAFKTDATMSFASGTVSERPTGSIVGGSTSTTVTLGEREQDQIPLDGISIKPKGNYWDLLLYDFIWTMRRATRW